MKQYCKIVGWQRNFRSTHWNSLAPFQLERFECCERPWTSWKDPEVQEGNVETNLLFYFSWTFIASIGCCPRGV